MLPAATPSSSQTAAKHPTTSSGVDVRMGCVQAMPEKKCEVFVRSVQLGSCTEREECDAWIRMLRTEQQQTMRMDAQSWNAVTC